MPLPQFSNFRQEDGINIADVKMIPMDVSESEFKKLKALGCCDIGCGTEVLSERQIEKWNDRLSELCGANGSTDYTSKVSLALFHASLSMQEIKRSKLSPPGQPVSMQIG